MSSRGFAGGSFGAVDGVGFSTGGVGLLDENADSMRLAKDCGAETIEETSGLGFGLAPDCANIRVISARSWTGVSSIDVRWRMPEGDVAERFERKGSARGGAIVFVTRNRSCGKTGR